MSRPFSYNDENFTVIGNILFVHFSDVLARKAKEPIIEVPPEIFKRLYGYTNLVSSSLNADYVVSASYPIVIVEKKKKKKKKKKMVGTILHLIMIEVLLNFLTDIIIVFTCLKTFKELILWHYF